MGINGELVKSVLSRNRSSRSHESKVRNNNMATKKRWSSVKSYLCGEEFNSVVAEEDSTSVKSSKATVTQPFQESSTGQQNTEVDVDSGSTASEKHSSTSQLFRQEDAAIKIQSAFRKFLATRNGEEIETIDNKQKLVMEAASPSRDSIGTSIEVQTGKSEVLSLTEDYATSHQPIQRKATNQISKIKEDWDDSTVSVNITKMRIQNRQEATTRRERALAYAFSQQLRICSKKKQARADGSQSNMSWSWLERWMATRPPPESSVESCTSKQFDQATDTQKLVAKKKCFDISIEEKESCGSNEVPVQFDNLSTTALDDKAVIKPTKNRLRATRSISRRKTVPSNHCPKEHHVKVKCPSVSSKSVQTAAQELNKVSQQHNKITEQDRTKGKAAQKS